MPFHRFVVRCRAQAKRAARLSILAAPAHTLPAHRYGRTLARTAVRRLCGTEGTRDQRTTMTARKKFCIAADELNLGRNRTWRIEPS